jgi:hypothetical protein
VRPPWCAAHRVGIGYHQPILCPLAGLHADAPVAHPPTRRTTSRPTDGEDIVEPASMSFCHRVYARVDPQPVPVAHADDCPPCQHSWAEGHYPGGNQDCSKHHRRRGLSVGDEPHPARVRWVAIVTTKEVDEIMLKPWQPIAGVKRLRCFLGQCPCGSARRPRRTRRRAAVQPILGLSVIPGCSQQGLG